MISVEHDEQKTYEIMTFSLEWGLIYAILLTAVWVCRVRMLIMLIFNARNLTQRTNKTA